MTLEIRPARPEEMEEFYRVALTALVMKPGSIRGIQPEWTLCGFEDGKLATTFSYWPLTMRYNGEGVPVSGVTSVGTLPIYRRHGHLRQIMTRHFELLHEEGERTIAILLASLTTIYQRYGYAVVSSRNTYTVEPRYLQFTLPQKTNGYLREAREDEFALLVELYRKFRENRTGYLHRGKAMWDAGVLAPVSPGGRLNRVVYEENGQPLGYVVYMTYPQPGAPAGNHLVIRDLIWLTTSAYRAIWQHFANMDIMADIVWQRVPVDDPLPHLLLEPRMLRAISADGLMARIVDVSKALTRRRYQDEGILTFEVIDDLCAWNRGRWKLETSAEGSSIAHTRQSTQLTLPVSTLVMLTFGQISATEAFRMGRLDTNQADALRVWDRVMRTLYRPACADMF